jgi:hypothetical protein
MSSTREFLLEAAGPPVRGVASGRPCDQNAIAPPEGTVVVVVGCVVVVVVVGALGDVGGVVVGEVGWVTGGLVLVDDGVDGAPEEEGDPVVGVETEPAVVFVVIGAFVVAGGVVAAVPCARADVVVPEGDDMPSDSTANQSFSTPCPRASPASESLTNV